MADYLPLALKYRPRQLSDLIGQEVIVQTLTNAIKLGRVHHAFLFIGPYGCGKTSLGRILAASINCVKGETPTPCGECQNCLDILASKSPDVIELDAASARGIDEIRELRKEANYSAVNGRYKVFIIDEAHQLTGAAAEAMLKVTEEPPKNVKFVFCTTEKHKMKNTMFSRCQDYVVETMPWGMIAAHLKEVCQKEGLKADDDALKVVVKQSGGHMRDALQHLDKVAMYVGEGQITKEAAERSLGAMDDALCFDLVEAIVGKNTTGEGGKDFARGVKIIQKMLVNGRDIEHVLAGMSDHLRTLLLIKLCESTAGILYLMEEEKKRFLHQSQLMKGDLVDDMLTYLGNVYRGVSNNEPPQVLFEQFFIKSVKRHHQLSKAEG